MTPLEAGIGQAPHSFAKAASERSRVGLSPATIIISAAESAAIPKASRRVGTAACVIASSASSWLSISAESESHLVANARSACFVEAIVSPMLPGRKPAQRAISFRSVSGSRASRSSPGAFTMSVFNAMIAALLALTAVSRATLIWRTISAAPSADLGTAVASPASTARAAVSASRVSLFP